MAKKKQLSSLPTVADYEGVCSRFTDLVEMKSTMPAASWEKRVLDRTMTILQFNRPDLLDEIKKAVKEHWNITGVPDHVNDEGKTLRCPECGRRRE